MLGGGRLNIFNRARADAARGHVDHAQQGIVVVGVHRQAQIGKRMFDFLALVKAQAAVDFIGQAGAEKRLLKHARLGVAAVEHGHLA